MSANSKPGIASAYLEIKALAAFTAKYRASILAIVTLLSPGDVAAVVAALDFIQSMVGLFQRIYDLWEAYEHPA